MPRPSKYDATRSKAILDALRAGNTRTASVAYAGIDYKTFQKWRATFPEFDADVQKAEADVEVRNVAIIQTASKTTWQAAAWWLERRRPDDWKLRNETAVTGKDGGDLKVIVQYEDVRIMAEKEPE
jgi:hypothetical protein